MSIIKSSKPRQVTHTEQTLLDANFKRVGNTLSLHVPDNDDSNVNAQQRIQQAIDLIHSCGFEADTSPGDNGGTNIFVKKKAA